MGGWRMAAAENRPARQPAPRPGSKGSHRVLLQCHTDRYGRIAKGFAWSTSIGSAASCERRCRERQGKSWPRKLTSLAPSPVASEPWPEARRMTWPYRLLGCPKASFPRGYYCWPAMEQRPSGSNPGPESTAPWPLAGTGKGSPRACLTTCRGTGPRPDSHPRVTPRTFGNRLIIVKDVDQPQRIVFPCLDAARSKPLLHYPFSNARGAARQYSMAGWILSGGNPRQKTCQSGKRASPSHCLAYHEQMGFEGCARQKKVG